MNRNRLFLCCLLLAATTVAVYSRTGQNPFANFDDAAYVTRNPHVQAGLHWSTFVWAWTSTEQANWHPLTWLSHAADCQLFGLNPAGHHWTSIAIHAFNVVLLSLLLFYATGKPWRSLLVAALFALHPFNVESVVWVAERKNVLSTLLILLTLGAYGWYVRRPGAMRYVTVSALFALALAAKPMAITLPFVLLLLDFWPLERIAEKAAAPEPSGKRKNKRSAPETAAVAGWAAAPVPFSRLVLEKMPLILLSAGSAVITVIAQAAAGSIQYYMPFDMRVENAIAAYAKYVWIMFWPTRLCVYYPLLERYAIPQELALPGWQLWLAIFFLLTVSIGVWQRRFAQRYLFAGWCFYLGTMVPVIGLIQVGDQSMADRYAYVPLVGIFVMVVWGVADWAEARSIRRQWLAIPATLALAALAFLTWRQIGFWSSNYAMWGRVVEVTDHNLLADVNFADALRELGRPEEALAYVQRASALNPPDPNLHVRVAAILAECGRLQDAIDEYHAAVKATDNPRITAPVYESLAILYGSLGDYANERESYRQSLQIEPRMAPLMIRHLARAIATKPSAVGYLSLGIVYQETGKSAEARDAYQQALKLDPTLTPAQDSLAALGQGPY